MMKKINVLLIVCMVMLMISCRQYNLYQYDSVTLDLLGGELIVSLEGMYGENYTKQGKQFADFGAPYSLRFVMAMPYETALSGMAVNDIEVVGEQVQQPITLPDVQSYKVKDPRKRTDPNASARIVIASVSGLSAEQFPYENDTLTATVVVYADKEMIKEEKISIRLNTNYKKERRNDFFDKLMGI